MRYTQKLGDEDVVYGDWYDDSKSWERNWFNNRYGQRLANVDTFLKNTYSGFSPEEKKKLSYPAFYSSMQNEALAYSNPLTPNIERNYFIQKEAVDSINRKYGINTRQHNAGKLYDALLKFRKMNKLDPRKQYNLDAVRSWRKGGLFTDGLEEIPDEVLQEYFNNVAYTPNRQMLRIPINPLMA